MRFSYEDWDVMSILQERRSGGTQRGKRKNKYIVKQQYWCKRCKKYFIPHDGFEGMRYPKEIVVRALHLYVEGLSFSKLRVMRGFKNAESAEGFTELRQVVYNFVRTHQGIGKTPAEGAELGIPLGRNRLMDLIFFTPYSESIIGLSILNNEVKIDDCGAL